MPVNTQGAQRTRSVAFVGLAVALLAVSAWVTVPLGPVPFTLQTFVEVFAIFALSQRESLGVAALYLLMGAVGLPVFSGMRGGFGILLGTSGGYLWGFLVGCAIVGAVLAMLRRRASGGELPIWQEYLLAFAFLAIVYLLGWLQLAAVSGMGLGPAFVAGVVQFIAIDAVKVAFAVPVARAVRGSVGLPADGTRA